jgi:hypothetical protein
MALHGFTVIIRPNSVFTGVMYFPQASVSKAAVTSSNSVALVNVTEPALPIAAAIMPPLAGASIVIVREASPPPAGAAVSNGVSDDCLVTRKTWM